jgi:t-SNARE complex subunit (syntaxin)
MEIIIALAVSSFGLITSIIATSAQRALEKELQSRGTKETIEERINKLTSSLQESTNLIAEVESEISERSALVEKLKKDAETYEQLVKLKASEVEAVAQLLRGELKKEGSRSFWKGVLVNFLFFALGLIASVVVNLLMK